MVKSKTPWENMSGDNSMFLDRLTKSERRMEREKKIDSIYNDDVWGTDQKVLWWTWRICAGIVVGLVLMIGWSAATGLLN